MIGIFYLWQLLNTNNKAIEKDLNMKYYICNYHTKMYNHDTHKKNQDKTAFNELNHND